MNKQDFLAQYVLARASVLPEGFNPMVSLDHAERVWKRLAKPLDDDSKEPTVVVTKQYLQNLEAHVARHPEPM